MMKRYGLAIGLAGLIGLGGCGLSTTDSEPGTSEEETSSTGLALSVDYLGGSDVAGFHYLVKTCGGKVVMVDKRKDLEDLILPGMIPAFENEPFDAHSKHLFSDHFMVLPAGCYDVKVQPMTKNHEKSGDCSAAKAFGVEVLDGLTTEILLVSQCKGAERGGLDVIAALNHPPVLKTVKHDPSKFVFECEETVVCATAYDPDNDLLEFDWKRMDDDYIHAFEVLEPRITQGKYVTECIRFVALWPGSYDIKVTVYDLFYDKDADDYVRAEDYLEKDSHASLIFPIHTNWDIEQECYDPETKTFHRFEGVREIERAPGCYPIRPSQFYCSEYYMGDTEPTCPGGEFAPETVYPICDFDDDHR
ncbi:MAG: hypothetical protein ACNA8W_08735 [Bradymonadaceae bacterium]